MKKFIASTITFLATLLVASAVSVTLSWLPNTVDQNVMSYNVLVSTNGGSFIVAANTPETNYTFANLPQGQYGFKVQAVTLAGPGTQSPVALTPGAPGIVELPTLLVANGNDLTLNWVAKPADQFVTSYEVWVSTNGAPFAKLTSLAGTSLALPDMLTGLYHFQVRAVNLAGPGGLSPAVSSPGFPGAPLAPVLTYQ